MPIDWDKIAQQAGSDTDEHFKNKISSLTSLNDSEVEDLITETGISKENLVNVLKVVKEAAKSNNEKANAIRNISQGVDLLVGIAKKII